jgi:hypothetical protein
MELSISGRKAIVCNVESHLAVACADALGGEGVSVLMSGSRRTVSDIAIRGMREHAPRQITIAQENATTEETFNSLLAECTEPDIVILGGTWPVGLLDLVRKVVPGMEVSRLRAGTHYRQRGKSSRPETRNHFIAGTCP